MFRSSRNSHAGFTLIEAMLAITVLMVGVLTLAAMLGTCLSLMTTSQYDYIAQQKALEAVESIYTARDLQQTSWTGIQNTSLGGIFLTGPQPLCAPGPDGIIGTVDDDCTKPDYVAQPNAGTGFINTTPNISSNGDATYSLGTYLRTITIVNDPTFPDLRDITVTITYTAGRFHRTYQLQTSISQYS